MHVHLAGTDNRPGFAIRPGEIHHGMPASDYHAIRALSNSSMKDLAVSPLRFWHRHINPDREPEPEKDAFVLGEAMHCMVLEPQRFAERFFVELDHEAIDGCLFTIDDLRQWLKDKGKTPKGAKKADIIAQVFAVDPNAPVWDYLSTQHVAANQGKTMLQIPEFQRIENMAHVLCSEPRIHEILETGEAEVSITGSDGMHGVPLKCRLDWTNSEWILDLKSFATKRGNSVEKSICDAIYFEGYYRQYRLYSQLDQQARKASKPKRFLMAFVESELPHDVRLKEFRASGINAPNVYHSRADLEIRDFCWLYKTCLQKYGDSEWIEAQEIDVLEDEQLRQLAFA